MAEATVIGKVTGEFTRDEVRKIFEAYGKHKGIKDVNSTGRLEWAIDYFLDVMRRLELKRSHPKLNILVEEVWNTVF